MMEIQGYTKECYYFYSVSQEMYLAGFFNWVMSQEVNNLTMRG